MFGSKSISASRENAYYAGIAVTGSFAQFQLDLFIFEN